MSRRIDQIRAGFFKRRLRSRGPWIPARVEEVVARDPDTFEIMDRALQYRCWVGTPDNERDVVHEWGGLHEITEQEFEALCAERADVIDDLDPRDAPVRL